MFPLNYRCSIQRATESRDRGGQVIKNYEEVATNIKCLFLEFSGSNVKSPQDSHMGVFGFYVLPTTDIREGDIITDISGSNGIVIEEGPLYVDSAKKIADVFGKIHHISCKLKGGVTP